MKRSAVILSIAIISFLSFTYGVLTVQYQIFPYEIIRSTNNLVLGASDSRSPHYSHKKSFFEVFGQGDYDIVFIGDSITENAEWADLFPEYKIANRGIGGDTSSGILERIDSIKSTNADKAFIMVGINDLNRGISVNSVFENYSRVVEELQSSGFKIYIQSTILGGSRISGVNNSIKSLNNKLKDLAGNSEGITYIDLNEHLVKSGSLSADFTQDDMHLNGSGYKAWKNSISEYVRSD